MTRDEQLVFCKKCVNRKMNMQQGLLCGLTDKKADFEESCPNFVIEEKFVIEEQNIIESIRDNKKRAVVAERLVLLVLIMDVITTVSGLMQYNILLDIENGTFVSDVVLESNDFRVQALAIFYLAIFIVSGITFIQWFRRAYYNLHLRTECNNTEGWASGAWFVPIISLFKPYKIMKELWVKTNQLINEKTGEQNLINTSILGIWWTFWLINSFLGQISYRLSEPETMDDFFLSNGVDMASSLVGIPLAIIAIKIIRAYSEQEEKLATLEG